tara:strand:+ start:285 stop:1697 length:1413 start_codon:yes stop_codon:yes gene_type:complete
MTKPYPNHQYLQGNFAPLRMECDLNDLVIEGEMPKEIFGSYYRNGPDPQFPPMGDDYHWFAGDGMIHAFNFENGKVSYRNRWVRTSKWKQERKAGKSLINALNPMEPDPEWDSDNDDGTGNTNIIFHGDKLLALEEGHLPFELDPISLESIGSFNYDNKLLSPMTAHPKVDPLTGDIHAFSYTVGEIFSTRMSYFVINVNGILTKYEEFEAPYSSMVHDFMVTNEHVIFPIFPLSMDLERAIEGKPPIAWDPDKGTHIGVMPKEGTVEDIKWYTDDPCFVFHSMNAYTEGNKIIADVMQFEEPPLFPNVDGSQGDPKKAEAKLNRWEIDLSSNSGNIKKSYLDEDLGEFPRLDDRYSMMNYRHGYYAAGIGDHPEGVGFNSIAHYDHKSAKKEWFSLPKHDAVGEPVFIPAKNNSDEGEGYLICTAYRGQENRSDLLVLDAQNIQDGPLATAKLPHRIPFGFHGNWKNGN